MKPTDVDSQGRPTLLGPFFDSQKEYHEILAQSKRGELTILAMNAVGIGRWTIEVRWPRLTEGELI